MTHRILHFLRIGLLLTGFSLLNAGCAERSRAEEEASHSTGAKPAHPVDGGRGLVRVETVRPRKGGLKRLSTQPGSVHAFESADLYAKVSGFLKELPVDIGDHVRAGQVVAVLDVPELAKEVDRTAAERESAKAHVLQMRASVATAEAERKSAEAEVGQYEAQIRRDEARLSFHQKQYKRMQELFQLKSIDERLVDEKEDQYLASEAAVNAAKATVVSYKAKVVAAQAKIEQAVSDVQNAEAAVRVAEAALAKAQVFLDYTKITSPYNGVISLRSYHRGDFIRQADQGGNLPLLRVQRIDLMRVVVQVPDRDVPYVTVGDPAVVQIDALPAARFTGKVARFADSEDHETRTMRTEIDIPNPNDELRDGMYGRVSITLQSASQGLTIPASTLVGKSDGGKAGVYTVRNGKAWLTPITVGQDNGVDVEVLEGLSPDSQVAASYSGAIGNGVNVSAIEQKPEKE